MVAGTIVVCPDHTPMCRPDRRLRSTERNNFMKTAFACVKTFLVSEDGPTAVEYAVMMALIIVVCIGTVTTVGSNANSKFGRVRTALK